MDKVWLLAGKKGRTNNDDFELNLSTFYFVDVQDAFSDGNKFKHGITHAINAAANLRHNRDCQAHHSIISVIISADAQQCSD